MLDPLRIDRCRLVVYANRQQEPVNNLVSLPAPGGKPPSPRSERDRLIRCCGDKSFLVEPLDDAMGSHVADPKSLGQIGEAADILAGEDVRNCFDVVLRCF